jgi:hypothetical protein
MTKKKLFGIFILAGLGIFFFVNKEDPKSAGQDKESHGTLVTVTENPNRAVIDQNRKPTERTPASASYINKPSPEWEKRLETSLKAQGGNSLKEIKIQKENSLVWMRDENPLLVESVVITLINQKDMESSFRALVDSQTGKVLESWDQTIFDPTKVRDETFRIKLDPRYTN